MSDFMNDAQNEICMFLTEATGFTPVEVGTGLKVIGAILAVAVVFWLVNRLSR